MIRSEADAGWLAGQMIMAALPGPDLDGATAALLREGKVGAICLFSRNVRSPAQVRALCDDIRTAARLPVFIAADLEGGYVWRLVPPATHFPSAMALGAAGDPALTRRVAAALATEMRACGIDVNLAPVVDVNNNPANPVIATRSFAEDPERVAAHGAAFVRGLHDAGAGACAKHFPGHGDTGVDSHLALPVIPHDLGRLRRVELPPFRAAVDAGVDMVMTAHVMFPALDPDLPATLSHRILAKLLPGSPADRTYVVVSDAMGMRAITERWGTVRGCVVGLAAGAHMVCAVGAPEETANVHRAITEALRSEGIPLAHTQRAAALLRALAERLTGAGRPELAVVGAEPQLDVAREAAVRSITLVRGSSPDLRGMQVVVAELYAGPATGAEDTRGLHGRLAPVLAKRGVRVESVLIDSGAPEAAWAELARAVTGASAVVMATRNAWRNPAALDFARRACRMAPPSILVALRDPYDCAHVPEATTALAAYCDVPVTIDAVADVLCGAPAPGRLPVRLT